MLAGQEALLKVLDRMTEGALVIDNEWRILYANEAARRYLGLTPHDEQIDPDLLPQLRDHFELNISLKDAKEESDKSMLFEAHDLPGVDFGTKLSIYMSRKSEEGWRILLIRDVTQEMHENKLKNDFLDLISHKFRTPLTVVKIGMYNLLHGKYGALAAEQEDTLTKIQTHVDNLEGIIGRLITFTSLKDESAAHEKVPVDIVNLAHDYCEAFAHRTTTKKVVVSCNADPGDTRALANGRLFAILMENILDNAVKFSDKPEVHIAISTRRRKATDELIMEIADDGPGIPPHLLKDAFQTFTQRDDNHTGNVEGLGLGLPTIMHLMQLFGGTAELDSAPLKGTTVRLIFPPMESPDESGERTFSLSVKSPSM